MSKQNQRTRSSVGEGQGATQAMDMSTLVGIWHLTIAPVQGTPVPALVTVHADGTLGSASLPVEPFLGADDRVIFVSPGHGLWEPIALNMVSFKIVGLAATERGAQAASATIRGRLGLGEDGDTLNGSYDAVVYDPAGDELATEQGALRATRITLEDQGTPAQ
jgi:hypothetical protein